MIRISKYADTVAMNKDLNRGRLTAVISIAETKDSSGKPHFTINSRSTSASSNTFGGFRQVLEYMKLKFDARMSANQVEYVVINDPVVSAVKTYRQIDFILPGN